MKAKIAKLRSVFETCWGRTYNLPYGSHCGNTSFVQSIQPRSMSLGFLRYGSFVVAAAENTELSCLILAALHLSIIPRLVRM